MGTGRDPMSIIFFILLPGKRGNGKPFLNFSIPLDIRFQGFIQILILSRGFSRDKEILIQLIEKEFKYKGVMQDVTEWL